MCTRAVPHLQEVDASGDDAPFTSIARCELDAMCDAVARAFVWPLRVSVVWCTRLLRRATADRLTRCSVPLIAVSFPCAVGLCAIARTHRADRIAQAVSVIGSVGFVGRDLGL